MLAAVRASPNFFYITLRRQTVDGAAFIGSPDDTAGIGENFEPVLPRYGNQGDGPACALSRIAELARLERMAFSASFAELFSLSSVPWKVQWQSLVCGFSPCPLCRHAHS
jgi:hypothetical protein